MPASQTSYHSCFFVFRFIIQSRTRGPFLETPPRTYRPENYLTRKRVKENFKVFCFVLILRNKLAIQSISAF